MLFRFLAHEHLKKKQFKIVTVCFKSTPKMEARTSSDTLITTYMTTDCQNADHSIYRHEYLNIVSKLFDSF
jgi:hypothetical protein